MANAPEQTINGVAVGFPGLGGVDSPFNVSDKLPLAGALNEAEKLLDAAYEILAGIRDAPSRCREGELLGLQFIVGSAAAIVTSLSRGFEQHPLAQGSDGYHA